MAIHDDRAPEGAPHSDQDRVETVPVWDLFVRIGHWLLVAGIVVAYMSTEDTGDLHEWSGYLVLGLTVFRILWGFIGSRHARFRSFIAGPRALFAYVGDLLKGRPRRSLGHNPLAGAMIIAMLAALFVTGATGYMMETDTFYESEWIDELHAVGAQACLVLIAIHVLEVLVTSYLTRENLVKGMITGRKAVRVAADREVHREAGSRPLDD